MAQQRKCVYPLCGALVTLAVVPQHPDLPAHDEAKRMQLPHALVHSLLSGPCPGSYMYVGFTPFDPTPEATVRAMDTMYQIHARQLPKLIFEEHIRELRANNPHLEHPEPESQSLRNPRRMGREPGPESDDWALGGREDEESGHLQQYAVKPPAMKPGIYGESQGNPVMSVHELLGMAQTASLRGGEAHAASQDALNQIEASIGVLAECQNIISALQGQSESGTLREWMYQVLEAKNSLLETQLRLQEAMTAISSAEEKSDQFKANLLA